MQRVPLQRGGAGGGGRGAAAAADGRGVARRAVRRRRRRRRRRGLITGLTIVHVFTRLISAVLNPLCYH
jgi:hypothetical protein